MRRWVGLGIVLSFCLGMGTEEAGKKDGELTDAKAILQRVAEALKKTPMVSYRAEYKITGWATAFVPNMEGPIVVGQPSEHKIQRYHCELKVQKDGSSEVREFTAGCDGENFYIVDPKTRTAHEDIDPGVLGANGWAISQIMIPEFGAPDALEKLLKTAKVEIKGEKKIGEEDCIEIRIQADDPQDAVWAVSKKDFLPRRITAVFKNGQGVEASADLILHDLKVNPSFAKSPFKLVVPDGFKKTDDFAP